MKTLYLVRHAKSGWKKSSFDDFDRPLDKRGFSEAEEMASRLAGLGEHPDLIVSSPALRALTTAKIFAEHFDIKSGDIVREKNVYEGEVSDLENVVRALPESCNIAMLFGHNPSISLYASWLAGQMLHSMPTCGVIRFEFDQIPWAIVQRGSGTAVWQGVPGTKHT